MILAFYLKGVSGVVREAGNKAAREKRNNGGGKVKKESSPAVIKRDMAIQTENDIITDENPLFHAVRWPSFCGARMTTTF